MTYKMIYIWKYDRKIEKWLQDKKKKIKYGVEWQTKTLTYSFVYINYYFTHFYDWYCFSDQLP